MPKAPGLLRVLCFRFEKLVESGACAVWDSDSRLLAPFPFQGIDLREDSHIMLIACRKRNARDFESKLKAV